MRGLTVLLAGGTGFLGSNLLKRLVAGGVNVVLLKRSFSRTERLEQCLSKIKSYDIDRVPLEQVFVENKIDLILYCATNYGRRTANPTDIIEANLILPLHLIQFGEVHGVKGFINTDTILDKGVSTYSLSKKQFVDWLALYSEKFVCVNAALEHFYGPLDDESKFVTRIISDLLNGVEKIDMTPGAQRRDFIYIDDVAEAIMTMITESLSLKNGFYRFEVGTENKVSIRDFVTLCKELTQNENTVLNFGALPYRLNEVMESRVDISELRKLGWSPKVSLRDGLIRMIQVEKARTRQ